MRPFSRRPRAGFSRSLSALTCHEAVVDIGFRQQSALAFDVKATVEALRERVPFNPEATERLAYNPGGSTTPIM